MVESVIDLRARYSETDQMGVVHHTNYLVWCEMGRTELLRRLGMSYAELEQCGVFLVVSEARIRYLAPARYDDRVRVRTTLGRLRSRGVSFAYRVESIETGRTLAEAETEHVCLDGDGSPRKLPAEVQQLLQRALGRTSEEGTIDALTGV